MALRNSRFAIFLGIYLLGLSSFGLAAPEITVRARTSIQIIGLFPKHHSVELVGKLQEQDRLQGIPHRDIEVRLFLNHMTVVRRAMTDEHGEFHLKLPSGLKAYQLALRFKGDAMYDSDAPPERRLDLTKKTPEIYLTLPDEIRLKSPQRELKIHALLEGKGISLPLSIESPRGKPLGKMNTDAQGNARFAIIPSHFVPGRKSFHIRFLGDEKLNPASARIETTFVTTPELKISANALQIKADAEMTIAGRILDDGGAIEKAPIELWVMARSIQTTLSAADGSFRFSLKAKQFPPGPLNLVAVYHPTIIWRHAARSNPLEIMILPPRPIPLRYYAWVSMITAGLLVGLFLIRFAPQWRKLKQKRNAFQKAPAEAFPAASSGVQFAQPPRLKSWLRRECTDMSGQIWDPIEDAPISQAAVHLEGNHASHVFQVDQQGRFHLHGLATGTYSVTISCTGYISLSFPISIPHRGKFLGMRVTLLQVRVRLLEIYQREILPFLPNPAYWGTWTLREMARHLEHEKRDQLDQIVHLTSLVERAYWSGEVTSEEVLAEAEMHF